MCGNGNGNRCNRCTNYCCLCIDLEIGTFIVAIVDLIWEFALLYLFVMAIYESILKWHEQLVFILILIRIISICVLIHGVQKCKPHKFWTWILSKVLSMVILVVVMVWFCIYIGDRKDDDMAGFTLAGIFFSIFLINSYMLLIVLLYQRKLKRMNEEPEINIVMYL
ncbi:hypothetical protein ACFFRR_004213 [Megaselia abdita]